MNAPTSLSTETTELARRAIDAIINNVASVLLDKEELVRRCVCCVLAEGHLLLEDHPGTGKTTLAKALARSFGLDFGRIQFTSDMLPSDILGVSIYDEREQRFLFQPGPIFHQVLLADEINRASPRTQSALLEAMHEQTVSVDNQCHPLPRPFLVLATQNPSEFFGTYPLPESQLDRFALRLSLGFPSIASEKEMLRSRGRKEPVDALKAVIDAERMSQLFEAVDQVHVDDSLLDYLMAVVDELRSSPKLELTVSTRASLSLLRVARALALSHGRGFLLADDLLELFVPAFAHRVRPGTSALNAQRRSRQESERIVTELVAKVPIPS
ncbi:MAG: AAA family ATPase [Myxococcota bacterium]|jgi:MoxR-like ATPase|nr:AAA family ATPase [Myxococcota bacterium]